MTSSPKSVRVFELNSDGKTFKAELSPLMPDTFYWYRAYLESSNGNVIFGETKSFKTKVFAVTVSTISATGTSQNSATLKGSVTITGSSVRPTVYFKYGTSPDSLDNEAAATFGADGSSFSASLFPLSSGIAYYFKAFCKIGETEYAGEIVEFTTRPISYEKIPEAIDLGLPSGIKWASWNLGATAPEDYGDYYAWGATSPWYTLGNAQNTSTTGIWRDGCGYGYDWENCPYARQQGARFSKYVPSNETSYSTYPDNITVLEPSDDAATKKLDDNWRMPTYSDFEELIDNTTHELTEINGISGQEFKSKTNGNSIFLPLAGQRRERTLMIGRTDNYSPLNNSFIGRYWSSSLSKAEKAYNLLFGIKYSNVGGPDLPILQIDAEFRYYGYSIRPVKP